MNNASSTECQTIQRLGSLCDCPASQETHSQQPCSLCPSGSSLLYPDKPISSLNHLLMGFDANCQLVDAYLGSFDEQDGICTASQSFLSNHCCQEEQIDDTVLSCSVCAGGEVVLEEDRDKPLNILNFPFETCGQLADAADELLSAESDMCTILQQVGTYCGCPIQNQNHCSLCRDGGHMALPEKPAPFLKDEFGGFVPNCALLEAYVTTFNRDSDRCSVIQDLSGFCGCPGIDNHCTICPDRPFPAEFKDKELPMFLLREVGLDQDVGFPITCELAISFETQILASSHACKQANLQNFQCGCSDEWNYFSADTETKKVALAWIPRVVGLFSFIGSTLIVSDVLRDAKRKRHLYNQIMVGLASFDIISAIAWMLSTLPNDTEDPFPIYGERGNHTSCKIQGFLHQLGIGSIFFNLSLCMYYLLCIPFGWRETRLKRYRFWFFLVPTSLAVGFACAAIPYYSTIVHGCHLAPPPLTEYWWPLWTFYLGPVFFVIGTVTLVMGYVYYCVRKQSRLSNKWRFSNRWRKEQKQDGLKRISSIVSDASSKFSSAVFRQPPSQLSSMPTNVGGSSALATNQPNQALFSGGNSSIPQAPDLRRFSSDGSKSSEESSGGTNSAGYPREKRVRRKKSKVSTAAIMEREVMWQSLFYVGAFLLSWPVYAATTVDYNDHVFAYWVFLFIVTPLQGVSNASKWFSEYRRVPNRSMNRIKMSHPDSRLSHLFSATNNASCKTA